MKPGAARLVFRDLPFLGEESRWAAVAGRLAAQQGRFWLLHDYLFANQLGENVGSYTPERLMTMAQTAGLDMAPFIEGLQVPAARALFAEIQAEAMAGAGALGISATPTVVVNGVPLAAPDFASVSAAIEAALAAAHGAAVGSGSSRGAEPGPLAAGPDASGSAAPLPGLAFHGDRRGVDDLDRLHRADVPRAQRRHRLTQRPHQVLGAVRDPRRPEQDALQRADRAHLDARATRQRGRGSRHAPVRAPTRRFLRACQRRADHERVGARRDGLGQLATPAHAAVRHDRHVPAGVIEERVACGGHVRDGRDLGHADAQHVTRRARGAGSDAHEDGRDALAHQLVGRVV